MVGQSEHIFIAAGLEPEETSGRVFAFRPILNTPAIISFAFHSTRFMDTNLKNERRKEYNKQYKAREENKEKKRVYDRQWKAERTLAGLCTRCPDQTVPGKTKCQKCYAKDRARYDARREKVIQAYGGWICACCGETEKKFLSLDHINNDGAIHRKRCRGGESVYRDVIARNFPPGFQVLCVNCNLGKKNNGGICPHQTQRIRADCPPFTWLC